MRRVLLTCAVAVAATPVATARAAHVSHFQVQRCATHARFYRSLSVHHASCSTARRVMLYISSHDAVHPFSVAGVRWRQLDELQSHGHTELIYRSTHGGVVWIVTQRPVG